MALLEDVNRAAEKVTGWGRPDEDDLQRSFASVDPIPFRFKDDGLIPNHPVWPLVITAVPWLTRRNQWRAQFLARVPQVHLRLPPPREANALHRQSD
jgi:hypothetical protein